MTPKTPPDGRAPAALVRPFVGDWQEFTVSDEGEVLMGALTTSLELDDRLLTQRFLSADGSFSFRSFGFVDGSTGDWLETYVFNDGRHGTYRWFVAGEEIITERVDGNPADLRRLRIRFLDADLYEVREERSTDAGTTWEHVELSRTRRT